GFYNWPDWQAAAATGAALLWRGQNHPRPPGRGVLARGSFLSPLAPPPPPHKGPHKTIAAPPPRRRLHPPPAPEGRGHPHQIGDRTGAGSSELIALITTITDPAAASAPELAQAYCQRWEEETGHDQLKTCLRGPGAVLRSKSPDMIRQEIYGYLLSHYAISAL